MIFREGEPKPKIAPVIATNKAFQQTARRKLQRSLSTGKYALWCISSSRLGEIGMKLPNFDEMASAPSESPLLKDRQKPLTSSASVKNLKLPTTKSDHPEDNTPSSTPSTQNVISTSSSDINDEKQDDLQDEYQTLIARNILIVSGRRNICNFFFFFFLGSPW